MNDKQTVEEELAEKHFPIDVRHPNGLHRPLRLSERKAFIIGYQLGQSSQEGWIDVEVDKAVREELTNAIVNIVEKFFAGDIMVRDIERLENCLPNPPTPANKDTQNS